MPDRDLFGNLIQRTPARSAVKVQRLAFEDHRVRVVVKNGETWWVAKDVAKALGYTRSRDAVRMLADDEKGAHIVPTPGGDQETAIVNEPGLYRLIINSRREEAERFRRWVFHEVLPSIRKTGRYEMPRHEREQKRLKCDPETAKARVEQVAQNKRSHSRLARGGAKPNDFREYHNSVYRGQFGREAKELREVLGIKGTPLDRMSHIPLYQNALIKAIGERAIRELNVPPESQAEFMENLANEMANADMKRLGGNMQYGLRDDPSRGLVIDVVRGQLTA